MRPRGASGTKTGLLVVALAAVGCPKPKPEPPPPLIATAPAPGSVPTGRVTGDTYVDGTYPISVAVPRAWTATPGADGGPVRVVLTDPDGDIVVTLARTQGNTLAPRPLPGCTWTFQDAARYRALKVRGEVLAATCTPDDPDAPRILAYVVALEGSLWHIEGEVTPGRLLEGKVDLDAVAGGVRFR